MMQIIAFIKRLTVNRHTSFERQASRKIIILEH